MESREEIRGEKALQDICWNAIHFNIHLCSFLAFEFFVLQFYDIVVNIIKQNNHEKACYRLSTVAYKTADRRLFSLQAGSHVWI